MKEHSVQVPVLLTSHLLSLNLLVQKLPYLETTTDRIKVSCQQTTSMIMYSQHSCFFASLGLLNTDYLSAAKC